MKVVLYLMGKKGLCVLKKLLPYKDNIACVIVARDSGVQNDYYEEIKAVATCAGFPFFDRSEQHLAPLCDHKIAIGWRWIISDYNHLIIMHDSLLPKYRGFSPLPAQLINGEKKLGVTALFASDAYDTGPIIAQEEAPIKYPMKVDRAIDIVSLCYERLAVRIMDAICCGKKIIASPQEECFATYSMWRGVRDYAISWKDDAAKIKRFIDAVGYPYKGATCTINGEMFYIDDAEDLADVVIVDRMAHIGKVLRKVNGVYPVVVCGYGLLKILRMRDHSGKEVCLSEMKFRTLFE